MVGRSRSTVIVPNGFMTKVLESSDTVLKWYFEPLPSYYVVIQSDINSMKNELMVEMALEMSLTKERISLG